MKKNTRLFVGIAMAVAIGGTLVSANAAVDKNAIKAAFAKAPGAEMAYIANSLVAKAKKADKAETAMEVLRVAVTKKPAVCVSVVSFICSLVPDAAADIAAEAVKLTPQYTREIARAAAKAAPAQDRQDHDRAPEGHQGQEASDGLQYSCGGRAVPVQDSESGGARWGRFGFEGCSSPRWVPRSQHWVPTVTVADASIAIPGELPRRRLPRQRVSILRVTTPPD